MRILVDEMPKSGEECLFKKYYNEKCNHWNCAFHEARVCSLDCGKECEYLKEKGGSGMTENEAKEVLQNFDMQVSAKADGAYQSTIGQMACEVAIKALEELQQYRSIGTVEEIQDRIEKLQRFYDKHIDDVTVDLPEYRELCKPEEIDHMKALRRIINRNGTIGKALDECAEYEEIGTVSECREAVEKQRAKKPILCMNEVSGMFVDYADGHREYKTQMNNWWRFPCCNEVVGQRVIVHKHIHDQRKKLYCEKCGQSISWERDNE